MPLTSVALPVTVKDSSALLTLAAFSSAYCPLALRTLATDRLLALAKDTSEYAMPPSVCLTPAVTPSEPLAPCPPGQLISLPEPRVQAPLAWESRNSDTTCVVPDPSERWKAVTGVAGSLAFGLSALISGASQVLIVPAKIPATVAGESCRSLTPARLYSRATPPAVIGM